MKTLEEKLKNPVWYSLNETHHKFLIAYHGVQFYHPRIRNRARKCVQAKANKNNIFKSFIILYFKS
jgi:hypothetical protein